MLAIYLSEKQRASVRCVRKKDQEKSFSFFIFPTLKINKLRTLANSMRLCEIFHMFEYDSESSFGQFVHIEAIQIHFISDSGLATFLLLPFYDYGLNRAKQKGTFDFSQHLIETASDDFEQVSEEF